MYTKIWRCWHERHANRLYHCNILWSLVMSAWETDWNMHVSGLHWNLETSTWETDWNMHVCGLHWNLEMSTWETDWNMHVCGLHWNLVISASETDWNMHVFGLHWNLETSTWETYWKNALLRPTLKYESFQNVWDSTWELCWKKFVFLMHSEYGNVDWEEYGKCSSLIYSRIRKCRFQKYIEKLSVIASKTWRLVATA
jgi:hypothetical protein